MTTNTVLVFVGGSKADLLRAIESADGIAAALSASAVEARSTRSSVAVRPAGAPPATEDLSTGQAPA